VFLDVPAYWILFLLSQSSYISLPHGLNWEYDCICLHLKHTSVSPMQKGFRGKSVESITKFLVVGVQAHIWHRGNGELLEVLLDHLGVVNGVNWNPVNPRVFRSASDDHTI
jgi:hypothetical protein